MKNDFEQDTARAAVDAVEARWRRRQELRQAAQRRIRIGSVIGALAMLGMVVLGGFAIFHFYGSALLNEDSCGLGSFVKRCRNALLQNADQTIDAYTIQLRSILDAPVRLLRDLPAKENPKNAVAGSSFYVLSLDGKRGFHLFALTSDGNGGLSAARCSPFGKAMPLDWSAFSKNCQKPYLIAIGKVAYLCGSQELGDGTKLKNAVLQFIVR